MSSEFLKNNDDPSERAAPGAGAAGEPEATTGTAGASGSGTGPGEHASPAPQLPTRTFRRSLHDRKIAGVCGGLGRWLDIDPLVFRVALAILALFGGAGVLLYGAAWLVVPEDGAAESEGQRILRGRASASAVTAIVVILVGMGVFGGVIGGGPGVHDLLVLVVLGFGLLVAVRHGGVTRPDWLGTQGVTPQVPDDPAPAPQPARWTPPQHVMAQEMAPPVGAQAPYRPRDDYGRTTGTAYTAPGAASAVPPYDVPPPGTPGVRPPYPPPVPPPPRRRREPSALAGLTLSLAALVAGAVAAVGLMRDDAVDVPVVLASALLVIGAGMLVGTLAGRGRPLILPGLLLAVALAAAATVRDPFGGSVGEQTWRPTTVAQATAEHRMLAGNAVLDLSRLDLSRLDLGRVDPGAITADTVTVPVSLGAGPLKIVLPAETAVEVRGRVRGGQLRMSAAGLTVHDSLAGEVPQSSRLRNGVRVDEYDGVNVDETYAGGPVSGVTTPAPHVRVVVDAEVGFGNLEVVREAA